MTAPAYLVPLLSALLLAAGIFLLRRGRWPRRVGTTPHCLTCDYVVSNLVTLPDELPRCPECGTPATPWRIRLGERRIRPSLIWAGGALAMVGILLITLLISSSVRHFQWIHVEPLGRLLNALGSENPSARERSWNEIMRRENAGLLSQSDQSLVVVDGGLQARPLDGIGLGDIWYGDVIADYVPAGI